MMCGFFGSGVTMPNSDEGSGLQSVKFTCPNVPRLLIITAPVSCCAAMMRYGYWLSVATWYTCEIGCVYQRLHVFPLSNVTLAPWSEPTSIRLPFIGSIQSL